MNTTNPVLWEILEQHFTYDSADECPVEGQFEKDLQEYMPGYDITVIDMDETDAISAVGDTIEATVNKKYVEDIQVTQWCTEEQDVYYYIIAIKIKGE